jgi:hypothetical protein
MAAIRSFPPRFSQNIYIRFKKSLFSSLGADTRIYTENEKPRDIKLDLYDPHHTKCFFSYIVIKP